MADEQKPAEAQPEQKALPGAIDIRGAAKDKVKERAAEVREKVINALVDAELDKRADTLKSALDKRDDLSKQLSKESRPTEEFEIRETDGKRERVKVSRMSKEQAKKVDDLQQSLDKLDRAIDKALNEHNYDDLNKQVK